MNFNIKNYKNFKYFVVLSLVFAFTLRPSYILKEHCSGGEDPNYVPNYKFFEPVSFAEMSNFDWKYDDSIDENLKDWKRFMNNKPDMADLKELVYKTSAENMQVVRAYIVNNKTMIDTKLKNNSAVKYLVQNKDVQSADYLFFAKTCEKQALGFNKDTWEDAPKRDMTQTKWLADAGKTYYNDKEKAGNNFLKLRFAYQAIRMAHYSQQYEKAIKFYDELVSPLFDKVDSPIKYWALAHKAGALQKQNKIAEATYIFAQVFDVCASRRASSFLSLSLENKTDWLNAMNLCKNSQEKANLYFMRGIFDNANGLEELNNIFKIHPESNKIPILIAKEMQKLEKGILDKSNKEKNILFVKSMTNAHDIIQSYNPFVQTFKDILKNVKANPKTIRPDITTLALGYLDYLENKHIDALAKWIEAQKISKDPLMQKQISILQIAQKITALNAIDDKSEDDIFAQVQQTKHKALEEYMIQSFGVLYEKQGQKGKAFLCNYSIWELRNKYDLELIKDLIQVANKKKITDVEKYLLAQKIADKKPENLLTEMHATILFSQDKLEEAINIYQSLPENALQKLENNPFIAKIKDCRDCPDKAKYNRLSLAQKIQSYKKLAEKPSQDQANQYLLLGNAYYNMTFFGNSWNAIDYYRSNLDLGTNINNEVVFLDCEKAKYYYERAYSVALKDKNEELAAQSAFMASKCEQNMYYIKVIKKAETKEGNIDAYFGTNGIMPSYAPEHRRYFAKLKDLKKTKFYQQAKTECAYFNTYLSRK